jgi:Protein of unknown function (DUF2955)
MSSNSASGTSRWEPILGRPSSATAITLRLAFGVAGAFVAAELLGWSPSFLAPVIALQFLARPGPPPSLVQALVVVLTIVVSSWVTLVVTSLLIGHVGPLILVLGLMLFLSFYAHFRGAPAIVTLLSQICLVTIPVLFIASDPLAEGIQSVLIAAAIIAICVTWIVHAVFPATGEMAAAAAKQPRLESGEAVRHAAIATGIIMPMLIWYLLDASQVAVVLLIVLLSIVRLHDPDEGTRAALGLMIGNAGGGLAAVLIYHLCVIGHSTLLFALIVLVSCLLFSVRITAADKLAPIFAIAFSVFLILLGSGLSPLPGGAEESFTSRLTYVLLGTAYAIAALSIVGIRRRRV